MTKEEVWVRFAAALAPRDYIVTGRSRGEGTPYRG